MITPDNADKWLAPRAAADYDFSDLFGRASGQIRY
jgi:hypothetical protein